MTSPIAPDALIARYAGMPLDFPPRTRWSYSNTGYVILARIVERVAEVPYARFVEERLLRRAGLTRATLARPADAATGHEAFLLGPPEPALVEADGWLFGAGDVWASARELAQWSVSLGADVAVPAQAREAMSRPRTLADGRVSAYGCGLIPRQIAGETVLGHSGWVGGFVAYQAFVPRTRTAVVLLVNDQHVDVGDLHERVLRLALDDPRAIPSLPVPAAQAARDLLLQLQQGRLDRGTLGDDARAYFDDRRVATAAAQLRGLPAPRVSLVARAERGGLEVARLAIQLGDRVVSGVMFRSPDGKIRQLLLQP
jgi:CubicO group peptidase (beta-lactamase class C family)